MLRFSIKKFTEFVENGLSENTGHGNDQLNARARVMLCIFASCIFASCVLRE